MSAPRPAALRKEGSDHLVIEWSDGHHSVYAWKHLRDQLPLRQLPRGAREAARPVPHPHAQRAGSTAPLAPVA